MFSTLQLFTKAKRSEEWEEKFTEARAHIEFVVELYEEQIKGGRFFLHEHPAQAASWGLDSIKQLEERSGVRIQVADQCMFGLRRWGGDERKKDKAARKRTKFMTNSEEIARMLNRKCDESHEHQELLGRRAKEAAKHPEGLCRAICKGLLQEKKNEVQAIRHLMVVKHDDEIGEIGGRGRKGVLHEMMTTTTTRKIRIQKNGQKHMTT